MSCSQGAGFRQSRLNLEEGGTCFGLEINPETETLNNSKWPGCLFLLWPLFARAPRHWFLENFLLSAPGVQSVFFCCAPLGAATFRRGQSKKKTPPRVSFFLLRPRGKAGEGEAPLGAGTGPEFFCSGPVPASNGASPSPAFPRGRSKKKNTLGGVFFFALAPCRRPTGLLLPLPFPGAGAKKKNTLGGVFFFALAPCRLPTGLLLPLPFAGAAAKKKHPGWCFFFALAPCRRPTGLLLPLPFAGAAAKKKTNTLGGVFFFCCGPARTLTHSLRAWVAMPPPRRVVFFFVAAAPPGPGWCFFFLLWPRPDAHSLTVGWGDFGKARVVLFFCCGPAGSF